MFEAGLTIVREGELYFMYGLPTVHERVHVTDVAWHGAILEVMELDGAFMSSNRRFRRIA
jgi:hypothetical protein